MVGEDTEDLRSIVPEAIDGILNVLIRPDSTGPISEVVLVRELMAYVGQEQGALGIRSRHYLSNGKRPAAQVLRSQESLDSQRERIVNLFSVVLYL